MGILLCFIFLANMVGAIILMPALVRWLMRRHETPEPAEVTAAGTG
jgi:hypothetical protein